MDVIDKLEELEDLLFSLDVNIEMLTDEKTKYFVYGQYYYNLILSKMNPTNVYYLYPKLNNIAFSTNQLMYEANVEQRFWIELTSLMSDFNFVHILDDVADEIEQLLIIFSEHAMNRFNFYNEYQDEFVDFLHNGYILDDCYYKSDINQNEYIELLNKYNKKLIRAKK